MTDLDTSTADAPGQVLAVSTLHGTSITRADRFIHVHLPVMLATHVPDSTDIELGTEGHGLGLVRYRQIRQEREQVWLYERVP
jgi:hypothetical protein